MSIEKSSIRTESITSFFILTFIITIPTYILIGLVGLNIILSPDMVFAFLPLAVLSPICSALILTYRQDGWVAVKKLLKRIFDFKRVKNKIWYIPTLLLMPLLFLLVWGVSNLLGLELNVAPFPLIAVPILLIMYFFTAFTENTGWMGFAFEPMREKLGITKAALLLGLIWGCWHVPMYIFMMPDSITLVAQVLSLIALRVLIVWLFSNTANSLFIAILLHAVYNVCLSVIPMSFVGNAITFLISAALVLYFWSRNQKATVKPIA